MSATTIIWMVLLASGVGLVLRVIELFSKTHEPESWKAKFVFDTAMQISMFTWSLGFLVWGHL